MIEQGIDLTACHIQQSKVDMDAAAFAYMFGRREIAEAVIFALYGNDERAMASAWAEAIEVALGNAFRREKLEVALLADAWEKRWKDTSTEGVLGPRWPVRRNGSFRPIAVN